MDQLTTVIRRLRQNRLHGYGYQDRHRQQAPEQYYSSCLTDAEWNLMADIFDGNDHRGMRLVTPGAFWSTRAVV